MAYVLKLFDTPLVTFEMASQGRSFTVETLSVERDCADLLPLGWATSGKYDCGLNEVSVDLSNWLERRAIPSNRAYVNGFLARLGLSEYDKEGIIALCKGLSLNDCYWVDDAQHPSSFANVNLYDNKLSRTLASLAFTGEGKRWSQRFASTPELTTNGALAKCWRRIDGRIFLYKEGSIGARNTGNEPLSEFYAAQVAEAMGLNHVAYVPTKWNGHFCSSCQLFTSKQYGFVSAGSLVGRGGFAAAVEYYGRLGEEYSEALADMVVFDAVVRNRDRHLGNFGLLVDNEKNRIVAPAPLFDHGLSLFPFAMGEDFDDLDLIANQTYPAEYESFDDQAMAMMGKRQRQKLQALHDFTFKKHVRYNWPDYRLKAVESFIQHRSRKLLHA